MTGTAHPRRPFLPFVAYLGFVVYGSLVPFEIRQVSLAQALDTFAVIPYLDLGTESRADWVANIVLYVPLAFLGCNWLVGMRSAGSLRRLSALLVLGFCLAVAVAVEFTQIFFAPRTVSLNDLLAETLGSLAGLALFAMGRGRIAGLQDSFARGGRESVVAAGVVYGFAYVVMSLFPYDFVLSRSELAEKLSSGNVGWLMAGDCAAMPLRCTLRQASEAASVAPLGMLAAIAVRGLGRVGLFAAGAALGVLLETLQLFLVSGASQGLSVLLRGLGLVVGAELGRYLRRGGPVPVARIIRLAVPVLALPYVILLTVLSGWFGVSWLSLGEAWARLPQFHVMPFYYHYWTSESLAMISLTAQVGMYSPVGLAWWGLRPSGGGEAVRQAALWAAALALLVELGKVFVLTAHPDPSNVLIAAASAAAAYAVADWLACALLARRGGLSAPSRPQGRAAQGPEPLPSRPLADVAPPQPWAWAVAGVPALSALIGVARYPVGKPWLCALLLGYGVLAWRHPKAVLFAVVALLPVFDLSPVTGRLPLDEFDLVVLLGFAVAYPRFANVTPLPWPNAWLPAAWVLLWTSWLAASLRGLWPWLLAGGRIPDSSHSPLEAWFVGKGMLWALLFVPLLRRLPPGEVEAARGKILAGLLVGLLSLDLFVLWERHVFVGIGDFAGVFRVTGTFASMNTGGAYIEAFLAFAFPALLAWVVAADGWLARLAGIGAAGLSSYAMMVTFSRGGYAGLVAGLVPLALALVFRAGISARQWLALAGLAGAVAAAAVPVLSGEFAQARLARSGEDLAIRKAHWAHALDLMDGGPVSALLGMGFGQYPLLYALQGEGGQRPGSYSVMDEGGDAFLRLGGGESVYLDQIVDIVPDARYILSARLRQPYGDAELHANLCKKTLLYSFVCVGKTFLPERAGHAWRNVSVPLDSLALDAGAHWPYRTIKLSLGNPGAGGLIDVDALSLKGEDGRELLANGGFEEGDARWLFVADQDLAWHIHQQEVEMYFAQGGLGLLALAVLLAAVGKVLWSALRRGSLEAAAFAGGLLAFLTVGLLGSTMDTARLSMLFYLLAFCAAMLMGNGPSRKRMLRDG